MNNTQESMFVRWECGCIGLQPELTEPQTGKAVILNVCDDDGMYEDLMWILRDMPDKKYKYLSEDEAGLLNMQIRVVFGNSAKYKMAKRALGILTP